MHRVMKWLDHERYKVLGMLITAGLAAWLIGCQPKAIYQGEAMDRSELAREAITLRAEFDAAVAEMEIAFEEIEQEEAFRARLIEIAGGAVGTMASGGAVDWGGALASILGLGAFAIGGGAVLDKHRGNAVIARLKEKTPA